MNYNFPRGSEWRKWDLHIHTPSSIVQNYGGNTEENWEKFITDLESLPEEFKVIGINDYFFIDGYLKVLEYKKAGRLSNIDIILPIIEFRIDKFTGTEGKLKEINFHVIFAEESLLKPEIIQQQFLNGLSSKFKLAPGISGSHWAGSITKESIKDLGAAIKSSIPAKELPKYGTDEQEGFNNLVVNEKDIYELLKRSYFNIENRRLYLTAIGKTEWDQLKWNDISVASKKDIINSPDLIFTSSESIENFIKAKNKLEEQHVNSLLLDCSDSHYYSKEIKQKDRIGKCFTWIKSDPGFEGLKQILYESDRICIAEEPPKMKIMKQNPEHFIDKIAIRSSTDENEWFDKVNEIPLNSNLVSIIGNKGSGKSALADLIGSTGNANVKELSFLNKEKFLRHSSCSKYEAEIYFNDKYSAVKKLNSPQHINNILSKIIYFSQSFVNNLCDSEDITRLQDEIDRVIFSHIPDEARINSDNLSDLIRKKTQALDKRLTDERIKLNQINDRIVKIEEVLNYPDKKIKIDNSLKEKHRLYDETKKNKPPEVAKPTEELNKEILEELVKKKEELKKINESKNKTTSDLKITNNKIFDLTTIISEIEDLQRRYTDFRKEMLQNKSFIDTKLDFDNIVSLKIDLEPLKTILKEITDNTVKLNKDNIGHSSEQLKVGKTIEELENKLSEKQRKYQRYIEELESWNRKLVELEGEPETKNTIKYFKKQLEIIEKELPKTYNEYLKERKETSTTILNFIEAKKNVYPDLFQYARVYSEKRADEFKITLTDFLLFDSKYSLSKSFRYDFFNFINQKFAGTFHTLEKGNEQLEKILSEINYSEVNSIKSLPEKLINSLKIDLSDDEQKESNFEAQILEDKKLELYDFIYGFNYLDPKFNITYGGKVIDFLSPGEKGTLLLIFYLLIDKDKRPIVIDQPEENLDNETVFQKLVKFIKNVKNSRQIIIVTHNPNLAVVCDSEQIIHAHIDKDNKNLVSYTTGSIENLGIRDFAINILEGTKPAFKNRKDKYEII